MKLGTLRLIDTSALRPGRAALALDFMEEFRRWADRLALTLINRGHLRPRTSLYVQVVECHFCLMRERQL